MAEEIIDSIIIIILFVIFQKIYEKSSLLQNVYMYRLIDLKYCI